MTSLWAIFILLISSVSQAEDAVPDTSRSPLNPVAAFLAAEGLFVVNAYMASESPEGYGAVLSLLSPLGASSNVSEMSNVVGVAGAFTLALYNTLELSEDHYSKQDIFEKNLIAWHVLVASMMLSEKISGNNNTRVGFLPLHDGALIVLNQRF